MLRSLARARLSIVALPAGAQAARPATLTQAYTMTCEVGGQVVRRSELTIARGQPLTVDPCGLGTKAKPKPKPKKQASCTAKAKARARHKKRTQG